LDFTNVYVSKFHDLMQRILDNRPQDSPLTVLYASSVVLDEHPIVLTEYAMAKAAGEVLCSALADNYRQLKISTPRLPRMLTNQTATVPPVLAEDPLKIMAPLLVAE
jgi:hypothetical protein